MRWTLIGVRPMTEEEKAEIGKPTDDYIIDGILPEDGQEVLISTSYGSVETDTFCQDGDGGCYFENISIEDVIAWMPFPLAYEKTPQSSGTIEKEEVMDLIRSYIHEIITESGTDKNEHTNRVLRSLMDDVNAISSTGGSK